MIRFGLWVNVAKNLRLKAVDYSDLGLGTEIPRPIITNNVSLRLLHLSDDPFHFGDNEQFACTLGGVLVVEILEMERLPKVVKGWHMLEVKDGDDKAKKIEYGPVDPITGIREKVPPMTVRYTLPDDILLFEPPVVARYDQASRTWVEEDINETSVSDDAHPVLSFSTRQLGPFAIMQDIRQHLPFLSWEISPLEQGGCRIDLQTQSCLLQMEVTKDGCKLCSLPKALYSTIGDKEKKLDSVSPAVFFFHLREMGIFLEPELDRKQLNLSKKSEEIEEDLHRGLSVIAQDFSIKMSQLNKELPPYMAVVAIKPAEWLSETEAEKDSWKFALFRERGEAKFEVEDNLRCCCIVPDDIVKKKEAPKEEDNDKDENNNVPSDSHTLEPTEEKSLKDKIMELDVLKTNYGRYLHQATRSFFWGEGSEKSFSSSSTFIENLEDVIKRLRLVSYEVEPIRSLSDTPGGEGEEEQETRQEQEEQEKPLEDSAADVQEKEEVKGEEENKMVKEEKPSEG